jgi:NADH:ubiquinone reductase (H+-translocating)
MKRILVLGAGFAGLWSAVGAARKLEELKVAPGEVEIAVVNRDAWHNIRVRNYEADLSGVRVPLDDVLGPVGVRRIEGAATDIDFVRRQVMVTSAATRREIGYDRLVLALGSQLARPDVPGAAERAFDVDTYGGAQRLNAHIGALPSQPPDEGRFAAVVVGSGLTGIEAATELVGKLRAAMDRAGLAAAARPRVVVVDSGPQIGSAMGESAAPIIAQALAALGVETRAGVRVVASDSVGARLSNGEVVPASAIVWCTGMRANPLTERFPVERDRSGRLPVDEFMRVRGVEGVFAAGDVASAMLDDRHASVMSCQHARPMGRFAGHNVVCDLLGAPMLPLHIDKYVTILDLGAWGALYTQGWSRKVVATGEAAKKTKRLINRERIYPPLTRDRREILAAAAPLVQAPPQRFDRA